MSTDHVPDGALDPRAALSRLEEESSTSNIENNYFVPVSDLAEKAEIEDVVTPSCRKYEVTYLARDVSSEVERKPVTSDLSSLEGEPDPPSTFSEHRSSVVRERDREPCGECDGEGSVSCYTCGGDGLVRCRRSKCRNGILKEACSCEDGEITRECGHCSGGRIETVVHENGDTKTKYKKCSRCDGEGELYETCPQCSGSGTVTIGECSTCTQEDPVGKVACKECDDPEHTNECRSCDGEGELLRLVLEHHDFEPVTDSALVFPNDYREESVHWSDRPDSAYETEGVPDIGDLSGPSSGEVVKARVEEYAPDPSPRYRLEYSIDEEYDVADDDLHVYVEGNSVDHGRAPKKLVERNEAAHYLTNPEALSSAVASGVGSIWSLVKHLCVWVFPALVSLVVAREAAEDTIGFPPPNYGIRYLLLGGLILALCSLLYLVMAGFMLELFGMDDDED